MSTPRDPAPSPVSPTVIIETLAGAWHLHRVSPDSDQIAAVLQLAGWQDDPRPTIIGTAGSRWSLEESLGFALPMQAGDALLRAAGEDLFDPFEHATRAMTSGALSGLLPARTYLPRPGTPVAVAGQPGTTYGRLRHDDPLLRTWQDRSFRIDIIAATPNPHDNQIQIFYRLWHDDAIVCAGDGPVLEGSVDPTSDAAVRAVARHALTRLSHGPHTGHQHVFWAEHRNALVTALAAPAAPYPAGTRILVRDPLLPTVTLGIVLDHAYDDAGTLSYTWWPDVYNLPGHPHADMKHIDALSAACDLVEPTLQAPAAGVAGASATQVILTYGARVRTIDDHRFTTGTVLRAFTSPGTLTYEIQPDTVDDRYRLPAENVVPLAGTAWTTVGHVLEARRAANLPLVDGEIIHTLRHLAPVTSGPAGPVCPVTLYRPSLDELLDPDSLDFQSARPDFPFLAGDPRRPRIHADTGTGTVHVVDTFHGHFEVPLSHLHEVLTRYRQALPHLLVNQVDLRLHGQESPATLAALAVVRLPDLLAEPQPSTDLPQIFPLPPPIDLPDPGTTDLDPEL